jgi:acyl-CoA synthetase (AMP-forming)/AMP-acid ligase II
MTQSDSAMTLPGVLRRAARALPDREFLRFGDESLTFGGADRRVDALAVRMRAAGVEPGDRVAILLPNSLEWPLAWLAVGRLGAVAVPVNSKVRDADLGHILRDSGSVLVVTSSDHVDLVQDVAADLPISVEVAVFGDPTHSLSWDGAMSAVVDFVGAPEVDAADLANLQYTSGTTGLPKACMLSHDYWMRFGAMLADSWGVRDDDVDLTAQAFSYLDPMWNVSLCLQRGIPLVILPRFSASTFWDDVRLHRVTFFYCIATMPVYMLAQPPSPRDREHSVRFVYCSAIPPHLHSQFEERWGVPWRETYGSTETGPDTVVTVGEVSYVGSGSVGRVLPGKEAQIVDLDGSPLAVGKSGELCIRGLPRMDGYWKQPEATAAAIDDDGWFHTGDLAREDADGHIFIVGRIKEVIRRGGENISPVEVESVLAAHPAVMTAAVVGVDDVALGQEVHAFVQSRPGADVAPADLHAFALGRLAAFKVPRFVSVVSEMPLTVSDKVAKTKLLSLPDVQVWDARS